MNRRHLDRLHKAFRSASLKCTTGEARYSRKYTLGQRDNPPVVFAQDSSSANTDKGDSESKQKTVCRMMP
jgi:hypothetical protein